MPVRPLGGEINDNLVVSRGSEERWLRIRGSGSRSAVRAYVRALYGSMGLSRLGGNVFFRTVAEEAEFLRRCAVAGVSVPAVVEAETDWMLMELVPGVTLKQHLAEGGSLAPVPRFLDEVVLAHREGLPMWDRWGGNEIVRPDGSIVLVDFDIDVRPSPPGACSIALAIAIRASLLWPDDRDAALETVWAWLRARPPEPAVHDPHELGRALAGSCEFYARRRQIGDLRSSPGAARQIAANEVVAELAARLDR